MKAIKAYSIPIEAPLDLIDAYFKIKEKALDRMMNFITYSKNGKAHLYFKAGERRELKSGAILEDLGA